MKNKIVLLLAILSSAGVASISGRVPSDAPVEARIPFAPIPAKINGQTIIAYELHLTNLIARELTLNRIEVFRQDTRSTPVVSYQNANLLNLIVQPGNPSTTNDKRKIAGGMRAIVYMWLTSIHRWGRRACRFFSIRSRYQAARKWRRFSLKVGQFPQQSRRTNDVATCQLKTWSSRSTK